MSQAPVQHNVLCFGEALWDCLPDGRFLGGAPLNVAYHLSRLGSTGWPVSGIGDDPLGGELLDRVGSLQVPVDLIGLSDDKPTGTVQVMLDNGSPSYEIVEDVAWDYIDIPGQLPDMCEPVSAIVYGSLAQRCSHNRDSLQQLFAQAPGALKVLDVNMRPPFAVHELIWHLAAQADLIKLNDEEAHALLGDPSAGDDPEQGARRIAERAGCRRVCVTAGSRGAGLLDEDQWHWVVGRPVDVRDTIGAGDSFLATLLHGLLGRPDRPGEALEHAARVAEFVAASDGATPDYKIDDLF